MFDLASVKLKLTDTDVQPDGPVSEALEAKIGQNINYLIDTTDTNTAAIATKATLALQTTSPPLSPAGYLIQGVGAGGLLNVAIQVGLTVVWSADVPQGVYVAEFDVASSCYKIWKISP